MTYNEMCVTSKHQTDEFSGNTFTDYDLAVGILPKKPQEFDTMIPKTIPKRNCITLNYYCHNNKYEIQQTNNINYI